MISRIAFFLAFFAAIANANASPVDRNQIEVLDGDTIRLGGETFRLVGFDAPETYRARCPSERELGNRATLRLKQIVAAVGSTFSGLHVPAGPLQKAPYAAIMAGLVAF
jgi:endonuclease YncB( thermonuclease family)